MSIIHKHIFILILLIFSLVSCSSGGDGGSKKITGPTYSGLSTQALITSTNSQQVSISGTDGSSKAVGSENANSANPFSPLGVVASDSGKLPTADIAKLTIEIAQKAMAQSINLPAGLTITAEQLNAESGENNFCGGSVTVPNDVSFDGMSYDITMTFNDLCFTDFVNPPVYLDGSMRMMSDGSTTTVIYDDLVITMDGQSHTMNATISCDMSGTVCYTDFKGSDGKTYRFAELSVSGDDTSGYTVTGTFFHPSFGSMELATTSPITFNCTGPQPDAGELSLTGSGGSNATITFMGCSGYSYCFDDTVNPPECQAGLW